VAGVLRESKIYPSTDRWEVMDSRLDSRLEDVDASRWISADMFANLSRRGEENKAGSMPAPSNEWQILFNLAWTTSTDLQMMN